MDTMSRSLRLKGALLMLSVVIGYAGMIKPAAAAPLLEVQPADHEAVLYALRYAGLSATASTMDEIIFNDRFLLPGSATILVSTNPAMEPRLSSSSSSDEELVRLMSYHIIPKNYAFEELRTFPVGTRIKTLLQNKTLLVTRNSPSSFEINNHELLPTDLCTIHTVACYAVNAVLDSATWGQAGVISTFAPVQAPVLPPPSSGFPLPPVGAPVVPPPAPEWAPVVPPSGSPLATPVPAAAPAVVIPPPLSTPGGAPEAGTIGSTEYIPQNSASATVTSSSTCTMAIVAAALMVSTLFV